MANLVVASGNVAWADMLDEEACIRLVHGSMPCSTRPARRSTRRSTFAGTVHLPSLRRWRPLHAVPSRSHVVGLGFAVCSCMQI